MMPNNMEYTKTGIEGLDSILNGGIVSRSAVLLSGNPGTGKTIFGIQYLYNGAIEFDEKGIYLSFEEDADDLEMAARSLDFGEWSTLVDDGMIKVYDKRTLLGEGEFAQTLDLLLDDLDTDDYDRIVIDSITMLELFFETEKEKRTYLLKFMDILKDNGLTAVLINEQGGLFPETEISLENFLTDGNIYLIQTPTESGVNRYIWVAKMRKQDIETDIFPMDIQQSGIRVHDRAAGFSMMDAGSSPF